MVRRENRRLEGEINSTILPRNVEYNFDVRKIFLAFRQYNTRLLRRTNKYYRKYQYCYQTTRVMLLHVIPYEYN